MKTLIRALFGLLALVLILAVTGATARAQDPTPSSAVSSRTTVLVGAPPLRTGGGTFGNMDAADDSSAEMLVAQQRVQTNISELRARNVLAAPDAAVQVSFIWPLVTKLKDYGFYGISNFVDHDPTYPNHVLDYNGGTRTYDLASGYNHAGTDIFLWPFPWDKMEQSQVSIVAAAAGTILDKQDGNPDHSCQLTNGGPANYVILGHADGSKSYYWHMKTGSVTSKPVGASIAAGEKIGIVGSSGNSTAPHLHFEVYDPSNKLLDPWVGPSNPSTSTSWWQSQHPYYDPAVNKLTIGMDPPVMPDCSAETPNSDTIFSPNSELYFTTYYHDQLDNSQTQYKIFRPDQSVFESWDDTNNTFYAASWWYWSWSIPADAPLGAWKFQVIYQGKTYEQPFQICGAKPNKPKLTSPAKNASVGSKPKLDWEDTACAKTYHVEVREDSKAGKTVFEKFGLTASKVKAKGMDVGKTYFWRVEACNTECKSSAWRSFTVN